MEKSIERLHRFIKDRKMSLHAFDMSIGRSSGYIGKQIKNEASIGAEILGKIVRTYPDLNIYWLLNGDGEMIKNEIDKPPTIEEIIDERIKKVFEDMDLEGTLTMLMRNDVDQKMKAVEARILDKAKKTGK